MNNFNYFFKRRLLAFVVLVTFIFTALFGRLIYVQVIQSADLQARALDQWTRDLQLDAMRGRIFDANGVVLADNSTLYSVYVRPNGVTNAQAVVDLMHTALGADRERLLGDITARRRSEITISRGIDRMTMLHILSHELNGVYFSSRNNRVYPFGNFLTQIIGFVDFDGMGQSGVELFYNRYLRGINGMSLTETDLIGRRLRAGSTFYVPPVPGLDVHLTINKNIQAIVENAVRDAAAEHRAKRVSAAVMRTNGEIVAMAQYPSFDLNNVPRDNLTELFENTKSSFVSNVFEPGSTFKILTSAAAIQENVIRQSYVCPGFRIVDGQRIKCWRTRGHGAQSFLEGMQNSCNCVFMDSVQAMGATTFYDYLRRFGILERTGIDIMGEASSITIPLQSVKTVDLARIGFGQAIAMTPIQLLNAVNAVVNGGNLVQPFVVSHVTSRNGRLVMRNNPTVRGRAINPATSALMRQHLESVVRNGGGRAAGVPGHSIGGKTGTAQKYAGPGQGVAVGKYISSFVGFFPAYAPEYTMMFIVDEPGTGVYYGSIVAAPYAGRIFYEMINYLNIPPNLSDSDWRELESFTMPDLRGLNFVSAQAEMRRRGMFFEASGEGQIVTAQLPAPGARVTRQVVAWVDTRE